MVQKYSVWSWLLVVAIVAVSLWSCGGTGDSNQKIAGPAQDSTEAPLQETYPIPPLADVVSRLQQAGVGYVIDAGNDPQRAVSYETSWARAINLGIYGADLSYASTYGVTSDVLHYYKATLELSRALNLKLDMLERLAAQEENQLQNKDSLRAIATQSIYETYASLCTNGQSEEAVLFLAGGWLEAVYLGANIASLSRRNQQVVELLQQQESTFQSIMRLLDRYKKTPAGEAMLTIFQDLQPSFEALRIKPDTQTTQTLTDQLEQARGKLIAQS